ncbi:MAG: pyrroline-5-carboxylate reductase [Paracoccaceae bacterium]
MGLSHIAERGMVMLGCGKMGSAMLTGWLDRGVPAGAVHVMDPYPSDALCATGVSVNGDLPANPAVVMIAVKPQMMQEALPRIVGFGGGGTLVISVAAGTPIAAYEAALGAGTPVVRAMPNTPAAVGQGITALIGNAQTTEGDMDLAETLCAAVGQTVRLQAETQMDAVTGLSGSGPAYVFHMIECLAAAGEAQGLAPDLAMQLAKATVAGAGALAAISQEPPEQLRINVTSPNGTTQAGLEVLMQTETGLPPLMAATVAAATHRSQELSRD